MSCGGSHENNANSAEISQAVQEINNALAAQGSTLRVHGGREGIAVASPVVQDLAQTWNLPADAALHAEKQMYEYTYKRRWSPLGREARANLAGLTDPEVPDLRTFATMVARDIKHDCSATDLTEDAIVAQFEERARREIEWERQAAAEGQREHSLPLAVRHEMRRRLDAQLPHAPGDPGSGPGTGFSVEADTVVDAFSRGRGGATAYKTPDEWTRYLPAYYSSPETASKLLSIFYRDVLPN